MVAIHKRVIGHDHRGFGQTDYEFKHTTACGYVREKVTLDDKEVTCKLCLRKMKKGSE